MAEDIAPEGRPIVLHAFDGSNIKYIDWDTIEAIKDYLEELVGALASVGSDSIVTTGGGGYDELCHVYHSSGQTTAHNVWLFLTWDSERFDSDGIHEAVTNPTRLTCKTAGKYLIIGQVNWGIAAGGRRLSRIRLNRTTDIAGAEIGSVADATAYPLHMTSVIWDLAVNDYVEIRILQRSGGPLGILGALTQFMMCRVGT